MKIESGKYYRTRDGRKVGPMIYRGSEDELGHEYGFSAQSHPRGTWNDCGEDGEASASAKFSETDLVSEWTDAPDLSNPLGQVFGLMPPETQEAMQAHGGPYEWFAGLRGWVGDLDADDGDFNPHIAIRVKPAPIRETVTLYVEGGSKWVGDREKWRNDTHRITFDLIDGKPDLSSIRMEEL